MEITGKKSGKHTRLGHHVRYVGDKTIGFVTWQLGFMAVLVALSIVAAIIIYIGNHITTNKPFGTSGIARLIGPVLTLIGSILIFIVGINLFVTPYRIFF